MKKRLILLLFLYITGNTMRAQESRTTYTLNGTINMDTGRISLMPINEKEYYPDTTDFKEAIVTKGKFTFSGNVTYPLGIRFISRTGDVYVTRTFYVEPGVQNIICNKDSIREIPKITNQCMRELNSSLRDAYKEYGIAYHRLYGEKDSLYAAFNKHIPNDILAKWTIRSNELNKEYNRILVAYVRAHPDSYVALWLLVGNLRSRYSPIYDSVYDQFSDKIKNTVTGKELKKQLDDAKSTEIGNIFPRLDLLDTTLASKTLNLKNGIHRYTLVDFWFSHCSPCLGQFPRYKRIYDMYKTKGLEIIGISVDKTTAIDDWKKVISDKGLTWPQYLDENGTLATGLVINTFPRNFLLDEHNRIIKKDITPEQLEDILAK